MLISAVSQNQPVKVEIKGFKTSHFLEQKTAPQDHADAGPMGHVERPQSEPASNNLQFTRPRLVPAADRPRAWDRSTDSWPVFAVSKTSHFDRRQRRWAKSQCEPLAELIKSQGSRSGSAPNAFTKIWWRKTVLGIPINRKELCAQAASKPTPAKIIIQFSGLDVDGHL